MIGVDLGTSTVRLSRLVRGEPQLIAVEPSVVAIDPNNNRVLAVGLAAREMEGKTPDTIVTRRPVRDGVIADVDAAAVLLQSLMNKAGRRLLKPGLQMCVPVRVTDVERRAFTEVASAAGCRAVRLVEEPVAAARGAGLSIDEPGGVMVVDVGGGTTNIAVLSMGAVVVGESVRVAGDRMDEALARFVRKRHNLMLGTGAVEAVKNRLGSAFPLRDNQRIDAQGRGLVDGLPRSLELSGEEVREALETCVGAILDGVKRVLEHTPPELSADIIGRGIHLSGGASQLAGLDRLVAETTGVPVYRVEDPVRCACLGLLAPLNAPQA